MKGVCILDHGSYTKMPPSSGAPQLDSVFQQTQPMWERLAEHITGSPQAMGAAAKFEMAARVEAASRMIMNHEAVLRDICNPSSTQNVVGAPLTQVELTRVPAHNATQVDQMMREVCRRLLGQIPVQEEQKSDAKVCTHNRPLTALSLPLTHPLNHSRPGVERGGHVPPLPPPGLRAGEAWALARHERPRRVRDEGGPPRGRRDVSRDVLAGATRAPVNGATWPSCGAARDARRTPNGAM